MSEREEKEKEVICGDARLAVLLLAGFAPIGNSSIKTTNATAFLSVSLALSVSLSSSLQDSSNGAHRAYPCYVAAGWWYYQATTATALIDSATTTTTALLPTAGMVPVRQTGVMWSRR